MRVWIAEVNCGMLEQWKRLGAELADVIARHADVKRRQGSHLRRRVLRIEVVGDGNRAEATTIALKAHLLKT